MKFVHIADLHLDTPLVSLKNNRDLIKKRRAEQKQVFKDVIKLIKNEDVDALFICGDMFEQKFVEKNTVEYVINSLQLIPDIKVFITPGNHDPYIKTSPYKTFEWPDNVTIFSSKIEKVSFDDVDIYGFGFEDFEMYSNELSSFKVENPNKVNVLVTHATLGGDKKYNYVAQSDLQQFDYVALGHIHKPKLDNNIVYPGSLTGCGFDECGEHGLVIGNIEKGNVKYEFRNIEYRHFEILDLDVSNVRVASDVTESLNLKDNIYRVILKGDRYVELKLICDAINSMDKDVCEIVDETHLPYDFEEIAKQKTLKGIFTRKMLEKIEEEPSRKGEIMKAIEITYSSL